MDFLGVIGNVIAKLFCLVKGINCQNTTSILLPEGCGKSWLASNCVSRDHALLIDLEDISQLTFTSDQSAQIEKLLKQGSKQSLLLWLLPIWKTFIKDVLAKFKHRDLHLLVSQPDSLQYLKKYIHKKLIFVPSEAFFQQILSNVDDDEKKKAMIASRTSIISSYGNKARVFTNWGDLQNQLNQELNITQRV